MTSVSARLPYKGYGVQRESAGIADDARQVVQQLEFPSRAGAARRQGPHRLAALGPEGRGNQRGRSFRLDGCHGNHGEGKAMSESRVRHIGSLSGGKGTNALAIYLRDRIPEI